MEKTIKIGEIEVNLKANARNLLLYRAAFGEDFMKAAGSLSRVFKPILDKNGDAVCNAEGQPLNEMDLTAMDSLGLAQMIWCMARTADNDVPVFDKWMDELDVFPVMDILKEAYDLIAVNMATISPIKNKSAAPKNSAPKK